MVQVAMRPLVDWTTFAVMMVRFKVLFTEKRSRNPADRIEFKRTKVVVTKTIKGVQRKIWLAFCSSLSHRSKLGMVWKVIKGINNVKKCKSIPAIKKGGSMLILMLKRQISWLSILLK